MILREIHVVPVIAASIVHAHSRIPLLDGDRAWNGRDLIATTAIAALIVSARLSCLAPRPEAAP